MLLPRENTFRSLRQLFRDRLTVMYGQDEADALFRIVVEERLHLKWSQRRLDERFTETDINLVSPVLEQLATGRPLQYVLGYTDFLGCRIAVDERVLIPRPETEELCTIILGECNVQNPIQVLDIGTGSGCIPIALKKHAEAWNLSAIEVDSGALTFAKENAERNGVSIHFHQLDVLKAEALPENYDVIVSNPPYVAEEEREQLMDNVLVHEPHLALFVPDTDTLLFYRKIATLAANALQMGGKLYFEINERFGEETTALVRSCGFSDIALMKDMSGKDRFVRATL